MRIALAALLLLAALGAVTVREGESAQFRVRGTVVGVPAGDTLLARVSNGRRVRVRLIGVRAPRRSACYAARARATTRRLALRKRVVLVGDARLPSRRSGALLAYASVGRRDLARRLVALGAVRVTTSRPFRSFRRLSAYRRSQAFARDRFRGVWRCGTADLDLVGTAFPNPVNIRTRVTYTVTVENKGLSRASGVRLVVTLPAATENVDLTGAPGCTREALTVTCELEPVGRDDITTLTFGLTMRQAGNVAVSARVASRTRDVRPQNNSATTALTVSPPPSGPPVIAAAGDIACDPANRSFRGGAGTATACRQRVTSNLLLELRRDVNLRAVLPLGDLQYECGGASAFAASFHPSWGRLKDLLRPVPGNHDYHAQTGTDCDGPGNARGYFGYFGAAAHPDTRGYYSFNVGA